MGKSLRVNIILDSRRTEKYEPLMEEMKTQGISYEIWPCLMLPDVVSSINSSHRMIVADAKERGLDKVCIAEDDVYFLSKEGWKWFLKNIPEQFDIYSAATYLPFEKTKKEGAIKVKEIVGFHLYIIHSRYYDTFLATDPKQHIDTAQKGELYVCYPFAALQRPGFSANNMTICNYNAILQPEDIYQ